MDFVTRLGGNSVVLRPTAWLTTSRMRSCGHSCNDPIGGGASLHDGPTEHLHHAIQTIIYPETLKVSLPIGVGLNGRYSS